MKAIINDKNLDAVWSVKEMLYDDGTVKRRYSYNRKRALRVNLQTPIARQLAGYSLIEKDLRNIISWLDIIDSIIPPEERTDDNKIGKDREKHNHIKGLFIATLAFYGKCFAECKGRKVKLEKAIMDDEFHKIHQSILDMRNNYAAHAGEGKGESCNVALLLPARNDQHILPQLYTEITQVDLMLQEGDEQTFRNLVKHLQEKVNDKIKLLQQMVFDKEVISKDAEYWYKLAKIE